MFFASFHDQSLIVDFDDCDILLSELNKETNPLLVFMFLPFFPISITIFCTTSKLEKNPIFHSECLSQVTADLQHSVNQPH